MFNTAAQVFQAKEGKIILLKVWNEHKSALNHLKCNNNKKKCKFDTALYFVIIYIYTLSTLYSLLLGGSYPPI